MTRKEALKMAIIILNKQEQTQDIVDAISKISEVLSEMPLVHWSTDSIFDAIEQWKIEKGNYPSASDLDQKGLPCSSVIKQKFKIDPVVFLKKHFPKEHSMEHISPYYDKTKEEWIKIFINEYNRIKPVSYRQYESRRSKNIPMARWIMKKYKIKTWKTLLSFCGLKQYTKIKPTKQNDVFQITHVQKADHIK